MGAPGSDGKPNRTVLANAVLVLVSLALGYLAVEAGVRAWMWHKYAQGNYRMAAIWSDNERPGQDLSVLKGWIASDHTYYYWQFDEGSNLVWSTRYHGNNLGLCSWMDYHPRGQAREYRIAVIGDSFTASVQMNDPWPDRLERLLNADEDLRRAMPGVTFKVYNYGRPAVGFPEFADLARMAKTLDPDLAILNYISGDFPRCSSCDRPAPPGPKVPERALVSGRVRIPTDADPANDAILNVTCESGPVSLSNDTCRHSFSLLLPPQVARDPAKVREVKKTVVREYLKGQLWTSPYPYALRLALGKPVSLHDFRTPAPKQGAPAGPGPRVLTEAEMVEQAARGVRAVRELYPGLIVTLHPTFEDLSGELKDAMTRRLEAADPDTRVVRMRERLPRGLDQEAMRAWYCLPHDGHMSDAGGEVYAQAMLGLVKERLAGR